jgi:hypothetical protein
VHNHEKSPFVVVVCLKPRMRRGLPLLHDLLSIGFVHNRYGAAM